jgi:threonine 3-dehydrogenase
VRAIAKLSAQQGFERVDWPKPSLRPDEVLIQVAMASICGTDLHIVQWDAWSASRIHPPMVFGHECCGVIVAVGDLVQGFAPGDYVTAEMHLTCGHCASCRSGNAHLCPQTRIAGVDRDGCFADFVALPATNVIKLPPDMPPEVGACLDSIGNGVHAIDKAQVSGKRVLVTGCGPIGLYCILLARQLGASQVIATDVVSYRLEMAARAGADLVVNVSEEPLMARVGENAVDVVLEMSGHPGAIHDALSALKPGGRLVLLGIPKDPVSLDFNREIIFKSIEIVGVNGRELFRTWYQMIDWWQAGKLPMEFLITHRYPLERFDEAIELLATGLSGKIILEINPDIVPEKARQASKTLLFV